MAMILKPLRDRRDVLLILVTIVLASAALWYAETRLYQPVVQAMDTEVSFSAVLLSDTKARVVAGELPHNITVRLFVNATKYDWQIGDVIQGEFRIRDFNTYGLEGLQNKAYGTWCLATPMDSDAIVVIGHQDPTVWTSLGEWRRSVAAEMQRLLPQNVGAVISGICLGEDAALSAEITDNFRVCGVSHLFAVSGLHLSILTQTLLSVLTSLKVPRRVRGAIGAGAVVGFILLMDPTASVVRAGAMCLLVMLGECFRRQADARNSMGFALIVLLSFEPFAVYDAGLLLSFLSTCGILFVSPRIQRVLCRVPTGRVLEKPWRAFSGATAVTVSASVATLPVTLLYFGDASVVGVLANPIITLPASAVLVLGWIAVLPITIGAQWIYRPLLLVAGLLSRGILWVTDQLASLPFGMLSAYSLSVRIWGVGSAVLLYVGYRLFRYRGVCIAGIVSVGLFCVILF